MESSEYQTEEGFSKPSFDGRLEYFKVLKQYMMNIASASSMGDFVLWYRLLNGMYAWVLGFIKPSEAEEIKKELIGLRRNIDNLNVIGSNRSIMFSIDCKLQDITEKLAVASKHLLLPVDSESASDFDESDFLGGSE